MFATVATIALLPVIILEIVLIFLRKKSRIPGIFILVSGLLLLFQIVLRSIEISFPALTNTYEGLIFLASVILLVAGFLSIKKQLSQEIIFGATLVSLIILTIASSPIIPNTVSPPVPALQSNWLILHVSFSFIGQGFFAVSFIAGLLAIIKKKNSDYYTNIIVKSIYIGYPFYTSGAIVFGSIWASAAWGSFWSWDPKETWALVTVLIYTLYLHGRHTKYIKGKLLIWLAIIGFLVSIFTFLGVNYLLTSLHSY